MDGFVQAAGSLAQRGGRYHTDAAGDLAGLIGENIAEHVLGDDHVELGGIFADLHGAVVHEHLAVFHFGVFGGQAMHHRTPQTAGIQHVGLVHTGELLAAFHGRLKADATDPLDLMLRIGHGIHGHLLAVFLVGLVLPEINTADEFPHHDEVDALGHDFRFQRTGSGQLRPDFGGTVVGIQAHARTQPQQPFFGALVPGQPLPLGAADGPQQDAVRGLALFQFGRRQRVPEFVDGFPAHVGTGIGKGMAVFGGNFVQHTDRLGDDLGARTIPIDQSNVLVHRSLPLATLISGCSSGRPWR